MMTPGKDIANLANLKIVWLFFEKIEFTANAKISMLYAKVQVSLCMAAMQKFYLSYMHCSSFCQLLICHRSKNASNCYKHCN